MQMFYLMVICAVMGYSTAHYHDLSRKFDVRVAIEPRDAIENNEIAVQKEDEELVACPVCGQMLDDECTLVKNGKLFKRCTFGTYINEVCGNRRDCYRGPRQYCTEKMSEDNLGAKCARGYVCNAQLHECVGLFNDVDSLQWAGLGHYYVLSEGNSNNYIDRYPLVRSRRAH